jgi:hypothetical protein
MNEIQPENLTIRLPLQQPIPPHLTGEIQAKLAYIDPSIRRAQVTQDEIVLEIVETDLPYATEHDKPGEVGSLSIEHIQEKVLQVVQTMIRGAIQPKVQILEDHLDRNIPYSLDPLPQLIEKGEVYQEADGIYSLGPLLSHLIGFFEGIFCELAREFGASPYRFPTLIPARFLARVNYFRAFPHSLSFATHLREDLTVIEAFSQQAGCDRNGRLTIPSESYSPIKTLLSPAVCYHLYFALADKPVPGGELAATAVGNCFRYEAINLNSLERLWNFNMREIIFVGSKEYVLANRQAAQQRMSTILGKIGLAYRVESANDPFFIGEFRKQAAFQSAFQLKFEIRARLPFKESTLAVGSYNYHQDFFGRSLNITLPDGSPAHTGCVAFGLERIAFSFLSQFGLDKENWPEAVRRDVYGS